MVAKGLEKVLAKGLRPDPRGIFRPGKASL